MNNLAPRLLLLMAASSLGACAATVPPPQTSKTPATSTRPTSTRPPVTRPAPQPSTYPTTQPPQGLRIMSIPGLENVIGATSDALQRQFGKARLNVTEGDARKLQFAGEPCVLDIYLYPLSPGAEPTATYVDARRTSDGLDVDRASCVAALKR